GAKTESKLAEGELPPFRRCLPQPSNGALAMVLTLSSMSTVPTRSQRNGGRTSSNYPADRVASYSQKHSLISMTPTRLALLSKASHSRQLQSSHHFSCNNPW